MALPADLAADNLVFFLEFFAWFPALASLLGVLGEQVAFLFCMLIMVRLSLSSGLLLVRLQLRGFR